MDAQADIAKIAEQVDFVFCAVDMKKDEIVAMEEAYAKHECPVVSNNSANRGVPDVPMMIPRCSAGAQRRPDIHGERQAHVLPLKGWVRRVFLCQRRTRRPRQTS